MMWFANTLAAVLVVSSRTAVHAQTTCFDDARCSAGPTNLGFQRCGITDDDIPGLNTCLDAVGRGGITTLDFEGNRLTTIPSSIFVGLTALGHISFSQNSITTIEAGVFGDAAPTIRNLFLAFNQLETLPGNIFVGMGALRVLFLQSNQLASISVDAFVGTSALSLLNLQDNALTTLPAGIFEGLGTDGNLNTFNLAGNPGLQCVPATSFTGSTPSTNEMCECTSVATCSEGGTCTPGALGFTCSACPPGVDVCDDPHMQGLRGQMVDWSGVDGGWYCLVTDRNANIHVNVRLTAPLPEDFPDRQLITGLSIVFEDHSLVIEVTNPYDVDTDGCPRETYPCLANGGLRAIVDGEEVDGLLRPTRHEHVVGGIDVSASNLPVECREFGGNKIWALMYDQMLQGTRQLDVEESFEDWILSFDHMTAVDWCAQYIAQHNLADVQSNHAIFKIDTSAVTVRLNVGTNFQGNGELDWDGRVLPDLEFWQMDVGLHGLAIESETLSGILGETARPVLDKDGHEVMKGYEAFRGTVEDYRVSSPLSTNFPLLDNK